MIYDGIISKPPLDDVLAHHGILGQKWGKKNGPPYPLDSKVSTGKRLKDKPGNSKDLKKNTVNLNKGHIIKDYRPEDVGLDPKKFKRDQQIQTIKKNNPQISKQVSNEMIKDFQRWGQEDNDPSYFFKIDGKKVTKEEMQKHLEKQLSEKIKDVGHGGYDMEVYDYSSNKNIIGFQIDGLKEYSDYQPLYIEYDIKKKKVDNWGYV